MRSSLTSLIQIVVLVLPLAACSGSVGPGPVGDPSRAPSVPEVPDACADRFTYEANHTNGGGQCTNVCFLNGCPDAG